MKEKPTITYRLEENFYAKLEKFTDKILVEGFELFKNEFANIDNFYLNALFDKSDRSDSSFRQTPKPFYLIEAIYYQIFEQSNRDAFNRAERTIVILPDCMSYLGDKCKRKRTRLGKICARCIPKCRIYQIMEIADKYDIPGYFSKRALTEQLTKIKKESKTTLSVIGISCLLTLASGMRSAKEAGVPARGVFLDFTGCEHWTDQPFTTDTAIGRFRSILEEKYGIPDSPS